MNSARNAGLKKKKTHKMLTSKRNPNTTLVDFDASEDVVLLSVPALPRAFFFVLIYPNK